MKRYKQVSIESNSTGEFYSAMREDAEGEYILHSEHEAALKEVVAKEREACAVVADRRVLQTHFEIAAAIRARSDK